MVSPTASTTRRCAIEEIVVDINCIHHVYPGHVKVDICGLEFRITRGQRVAVLGANGSGKSTLLKHILGLLEPTDGRVTVFGKKPARQYPEIRPRIGAVMQHVPEQLIGPTVYDDVAFAPLNFGFSRQETAERVEYVLHALGIEHLRDRLPHYLSGGEQKKVALAGALVFRPELLVLDEPFEGVDYKSRCDIAEVLNRLHRETGLTIIATSHDMDAVHELADEGYLMKYGGRLEVHGPLVDLFFEQDLAEYNLSPPVVVQVIKDLRAQGFALDSTLDIEVLTGQLAKFGKRVQTHE